MIGQPTDWNSLWELRVLLPTLTVLTSAFWRELSNRQVGPKGRSYPQVNDDSWAARAPPRRRFGEGWDLARHGWARLARGGRERAGFAFMPAAWHTMQSWASEKMLQPSSSGGVAA
jgi:hypothetical protein